MSTYRAIRDSYGWRGRHWTRGDIAEGVRDHEKIPEHFELVQPGESLEKPMEDAFVPPEPTTLSEIQEEGKKRPKTGKEYMTEPDVEAPKKARRK